VSRKRRRKKHHPGGFDILESLIDHGVDRMADRVRDVIGHVSERFVDEEEIAQGAGYPCSWVDPHSGVPCPGLTRLVCASCRKPFCNEHWEFRNRDEFCICRRCTDFLFAAGRKEFKRILKQRAAQRRAPPAGPMGPTGPAPWEILGVQPDASVQEIKRAYRQRASKVHPDMVPAEEREAASEQFVVLTKAYDALIAAARKAG